MQRKQAKPQVKFQMLINQLISTVVPILMISALLGGCGTVKNLLSSDDAETETSVAATKPSTDITIPPTIPRAESERVVETSPDETISFDEWRKQREEASESE